VISYRLYAVDRAEGDTEASLLYVDIPLPTCGTHHSAGAEAPSGSPSPLRSSEDQCASHSDRGQQPEANPVREPDRAVQPHKHAQESGEHDTPTRHISTPARIHPSAQANTGASLTPPLLVDANTVDPPVCAPDGREQCSPRRKAQMSRVPRVLW
jgi:hypothetical protein